MKSFKPDGIEIIKKAVENGLASAKEKSVSIVYLGAGKYQIKAFSTDFKKAEKSLNNAVEEISSQLKSLGGTAEFERTES